MTLSLHQSLQCLVFPPPPCSGSQSSASGTHSESAARQLLYQENTLFLGPRCSQSEAGHPSFAKEVPYEEPGPLRHPAGQSLLMDIATGPKEQRRAALPTAHRPLWVTPGDGGMASWYFSEAEISQ